MGQAQACGRVKPVYGIWISNSNTYINDGNNIPLSNFSVFSEQIKKTSTTIQSNKISVQIYLVNLNINLKGWSDIQDDKVDNIIAFNIFLIFEDMLI